MLLPKLSLDEVRARVREAGALLRVAQQYARDANEDVSKAEHASARIQSICREVEQLLPGMREPSAPDPELQAALEGLSQALPAAPPKAAEEDAAVDAEASDAGEAVEGDDADAPEGDDETDDAEWDIDYAKLAAAIDNEALMAPFPEPQRTMFRRAAQYLIESHERQELFQTVVDGFDELSALTRQNVQEVQQKLALALTLEELASKKRA